MAVTSATAPHLVPVPQPLPTRAAIYQSNRAFYDGIWRHARLSEPERSTTWDAVSELIEGRGRLLEIGPGLRPRLPLAATTYVDLSQRATRSLRERAPEVVLGNGALLPFADETFDLVCALDVVEHADQPDRVLSEAARVLRPGGDLLVAVPLHQSKWTRFDTLVGHHCRFEAAQIREITRSLGLRVARSAPFGSVPRSKLLMGIAAWVLERFPGAAIRFEDRLVLPLFRRLGRPVRWKAGLDVPRRVDGILLQCRKPEARWHSKLADKASPL